MAEPLGGPGRPRHRQQPRDRRRESRSRRPPRAPRVAVHYHQSEDGASRDPRAQVREAGADGARLRARTSPTGGQAERLVERVIDRFGADRRPGQQRRADPGRARSWRSSPADWDEVIATDLTAAFHTCRPPAVDGRAGSGSIVNIASRLGQMGVAETAAYSAAKAGLIGLTRSLAREFGPRGVRVNAVAPA